MKVPSLLALGIALHFPALPADLQILSVQSAAASTQGLPSRGSLATLFARGLDAVPKLATADRFPLPTELAGIRVRVRGALAPLLAVANFGSFQQVNFQVPNEPMGRDCQLSLLTSVPVVIEYGNQASQILIQPINVRGLSPGTGEIFEVQGNGAFFHTDFSLVTADRPATPGETIIILATGLGPTTPPVPSGEAAPSKEPLARFAPKQQCSEASVDGYVVTLLDSTNLGVRLVPGFVGLMPGLAGVFQINVQLPMDLVPFGRGPFSLAIERDYCEGLYCPPRSGIYYSTPRKLPLRF